MKHFKLFIIVFLVSWIAFAACKTTRTSEKAVNESETAAVTATRLTFYRTLDSLCRQFNLSADSISMIFQDASLPVLPTALPSEIEGWSETPSDSPSKPKALKIYGLHLAASSKEKSATVTDLRDSVATATQSQKSKSATKQKTAPPATFRWLPVILIIILFICLALILIRYIHKHTFFI